MTDIAQVLLPPPVRTPQTFVATRARDDVSAGADPHGEAARGRRFKFRVYEGGDTSAAQTEYDARRAGTAARLSAPGGAIDDSSGPGARGSIGNRRLAPGLYSRINSGPGASSTFLAQSIAQEQLGAGLHNPPNAAATAAYDRAGAALAPRARAGLDISA